MWGRLSLMNELHLEETSSAAPKIYHNLYIPPVSQFRRTMLSVIPLIGLTSMWYLLHFAALYIVRATLIQTGIPGLSHRVVKRMSDLQGERQLALRRLVRAQLYYMIAGPLGAWLLWQCRSLHDLNHLFTQWHERGFLLALSHWFVALLEDAATPNEFDVREPATPKKPNPRVLFSLYHLYLLHHVVAIVAFGTCLYTRSLPGLGACGLVFELPVAFINLRDLLRGFDAELQWFKPLGGWSTLDIVWLGTTLTSLVGRVGPIILYVYGLTHWSAPGGVASLASTSRVAYVVFGAFFSLLSLMWIAYLNLTYVIDIEVCKAENALQNSDDAVLSSAASDADSNVDAPLMPRSPSSELPADELELGELQPRDGENGSGSAAAAAAAKLQAEEEPESSELRQLPIMPTDTYAKHVASGDSRLLLAIDGIIYDLTEFAQSHPGGLAPLQRHRGSLTATDNFNAVGHSDKAKRLMKRYAIALLPPSASAGSLEERIEQRKTTIEKALKDEKFRKTDEPYTYGDGAAWPLLAPGVDLFVRSQLAALTMLTYLLLHPIPALATATPTASDATPTRPSDLMTVLSLPKWTVLLWLAALRSASLRDDGCRCIVSTDEDEKELTKRLNSKRVDFLAVMASPACHAHAVVAIAAHVATLMLLSQSSHAAVGLAAAHMMMPICISTARSMVVTSRGFAAVALACTAYLVLLPTLPPYGWELPGLLLPLATALGDAQRVIILATTCLTLCELYLEGACRRALPSDSKNGSIWLAAVYSTLALLVLPMVAPSTPGAASAALWPSSFGEALWLAAMIYTVASKFGVTDDLHGGLIPWTACAELRCAATTVVALWIAYFRNELSGGTLLAVLLPSVWHMNRLYSEAMARMRIGPASGEDRQYAWNAVVVGLADTIRLGLAIIFHILGKIVVAIANVLSPRPVRFYCHPTACADHGDGVEMGVAYFIYPGGASQEEFEKKGRKMPPSHKPSTFVCNIGHMDREKDPKDWLRLGHSTIKMSDSLKLESAATAGFCGQYLAEFPADRGGVRQLNLTAWSDDKSAHDWYVNNEEHKRVVEWYRGGLLTTFSSMLARLHVAGGQAPRFHVRCVNCRALLTGYPEQRFCKECGWEGKYMPLF